MRHEVRRERTETHRKGGLPTGLPVFRPAFFAIMNRVVSASGQLMEKPFVLIVEDERDIAALFRHVMDLAGYRTEIAANGKIALERLAECQPAVVLLDLSLPGVSGVNVLQRMRVDERLKGIPVVVVTAHAELAESMAVEPDLVMLKPVSPVQLTDLVRRLAHSSKQLETAPFGVAPWDAITGLYNRAFFLYRLDSAIRGAKANTKDVFAVFCISPDRYELINHQSGARQANEFLHSLGEHIKACVRPTDTIARFDGDQFFILIEQAPALSIPEMIATRIQRRLQDVSSGDSLFMSSIGVLLCDARYGNVDEIVRDARSAYARAAANGRGSCLTFDHDSIRIDRTPAS
jgi:diguanylate cyclase (GGDEF)-like protein